MKPDHKRDALLRLKTVRGHLDGVIAMVEREDYCPDLMKQVAALQASLEKVNRVLLQNHLETCVTEAIAAGSGDAKIAELLEALRYTSALTDLRERFDPVPLPAAAGATPCPARRGPPPPRRRRTTAAGQDRPGPGGGARRGPPGTAGAPPAVRDSPMTVGPAPGATLPRTLEIEGMHCASCVARVEQALAEVPGVRSASVNLATERAEVVAAAGVTIAALEEAVRQAGFTARARADRTRPRRGRSGCGGEPATVAPGAGPPSGCAGSSSAWGRSSAPPSWSSPTPSPPPAGPIRSSSSSPSPSSSGWGPPSTAGRSGPCATAAPPWTRWSRWAPTIAFGYSAAATLAPPLRGRPTYFDVAALIVTYISVGKYLETVARGKAGEAIEELATLQPRIAHRLEEGDPARIADVDTRALMPGDIVLVRPGEPIPTDGRVVDGVGAVDESLLTGESMPVDKGEGAELIGGTVNGGSPLRMRVERTGSATVLAQIVRLVERNAG